MKLVCEQGSDSLRRKRSLDEKAGTHGGILKNRNVEKRPGRFRDGKVLRLFGETDDLQPFSLHLESLTDGISAAPEFSSHRFIHHGDGGGVCVVRDSEIAAGIEGDPCRGEVARADLIVINVRLLIR